MTTTFRALNFEADDWGYVKEAIPRFLYVEDVRGIVAIRNNRIGAMTLFNNWSDSACTGHQIVTDRRVLTEGFYEEVWGWIFGPAKRKKVFGFIHAEHTASIRLAQRQGFVEVYRLKDAESLGVDTVVLELTEATCGYT